MSTTRLSIACVVALTALTTQPLAAPARLLSAAATSRITIDGLVDEWPVLQPLEATHFSVAAQNDGRNLFLMIATSDQARRQQLTVAGLIVWLDAEGGKKRTFGIRIPGMLFGSGDRPGGGLGRRAGAPPSGTPSRDWSTTSSLPPLTYFEIVGPRDDDRRRVEISSTRSIQIAREQFEGTVMLELQIPLQRNDAAQYAIGTHPGGIIGLGFETPKIDRPEGPPPNAPGGGKRPGGGMGGGGRGGGRRGGMGSGPPAGGRGPRNRIDAADALKYWTTVQLAAPRSP